MELDRNDALLKAHIQLVLEKVGKVYESWPAYQNARRKAIEQLHLAGEADGELEKKEELLTCCEIAVAIVAYYSGLQDGWRQAKQVDSDCFIQHVMDFSAEMFQ